MSISSPIQESVLVVDDVPLNLDVIVEYLIDAGFEVFVATSGEETLEQLKLVSPDLILLDVMLTGMDGFETCECIKKDPVNKDIPVIFMTALSEISDKVRGFKAGGVDYVTKPIQREEILARVNTHLTLRRIQQKLHTANDNLEKRVLERTSQLNDALEKVEQLKDQLQAENDYLHEEIKSSHNYDEVIGTSTAIHSVLRDVDQVAKTEATVLIYGETGTGKELIARAVHTESSRNNKPFIKVNCAAIPENLVESEFFGHEKGAFTGATSKREGRFSLADHGTIFLDEIGELPLDLQSKLLRVLQEGEFDPVGSSQTRKVDVRVITATNRDLQQAVKDGIFREDLYYRLGVFPINVPPLRERENDILLLASTFMGQFAKKLGRKLRPLSEESKLLLKNYHWPGNIRELQNVIERAIISARDGQINLNRALPGAANPVLPGKLQKGHEDLRRILTVRELQELERENILLALNTAEWRVAGANGAAAILEMKPTTLSSRIKALGIKKS